MLMTPSRPKVIASPSAANSSTLASDRPCSRLPPMADQALVALDGVDAPGSPPPARRRPSRRVRRRAPWRSAAAARRETRRCRSCRSRPAPRCAPPVRCSARSARATASCSASRTPASFSRSSARWSSVAASADPLFDSSSAAARRTAAAGAPSCSCASTGSATRRISLPTSTSFSGRGAGVTTAPVSGWRTSRVFESQMYGWPSAPTRRRSSQSASSAGDAARIVERRQLADARLDRVARRRSQALRSHLRARRRGPADWRRRRRR